MHRSLATGFTLVESLVALSIVAALAAIAFPLIASAKRSAKQTECTSNLRQLYQAITIYRADHEGAPVGNPATMGLPPNILRLEKLYRLPPEVHQCREGSIPGQSFGVYIYFAAFRDDPIRATGWTQQVEAFGEDAILFADANHNPQPLRLSPFLPAFAIGARLNGSVVRKRRTGDPRTENWWH